MAARSQHADSVVHDHTAAIIARLDHRLTEITQHMYRTLTSEIFELRGDPQMLELLSSSIEGNVNTIFHALQHQIPLERVQPPTAALEYARRLAQRGIPVNALVRAYRLGQQALLDLVLFDVRESNLDSALALDVFAHITAVGSEYIDWISQQLVDVYGVERDHWLENRQYLRAVRLREVLDAADIDTDEASAALGYQLRYCHVALVLWFPEHENSRSELAALEHTVRDIAESLGTHDSPLFIAADRVTGWAWIPLNGTTTEDTIIAHIRKVLADHPGAPSVSVGAALADIAGFRRSHHQALNARSVMTAAGTAARGVIPATDPGLSVAALVGQNIPEARTWVRQTLGPLATDTDPDARLRDTLRIFLHHSNYKTAAEELHLHFNSVKYRVLRAIERRGKPVTDDRLNVELALLLCHWYGTAVLNPNQDETEA
jgi:hypothetical protein